VLALAVTLVTIHAVVHVTANIGVTEFRGVVVTVATCALEDRIVARIRMASRADSVRVAMIHVEPGVIENGPGPSGRRVTRGAGRREPGGSVIRVGRAVVIALVATHAGGR